MWHILGNITKYFFENDLKICFKKNRCNFTKCLIILKNLLGFN